MRFGHRLQLPITLETRKDVETLVQFGTISITYLGIARQQPMLIFDSFLTDLGMFLRQARLRQILVTQRDTLVLSISCPHRGDHIPLAQLSHSVQPGYWSNCLPHRVVDASGPCESIGFGETTEALTLQALRQLNVATEARFIPVNGIELHTIIAGPLDGPLYWRTLCGPTIWNS